MALRDERLQETLLQLPAALRDRAEEMAVQQHLSLNLFVATAIAEKLQRMQLHECLDASERDELPVTQLAKDLTFIH